MEISVKSNYAGTEIICVAENVKVVEDISETLYELKEDGKKDFSKRVGKDVTNAYMEMFTRLLDDIVYYRQANFDSSDLVKNLFEKLPEEKQKELVQHFNNSYDFEEVSTK